ncbi:MAG: NADH-quinone oxidoreductase subunit C, partial [Calditrichia bacterium]
MIDFQAIKKEVAKKDKSASFEEFRDELTVRVPKENLTRLMTFLKDEKTLSFDYLTDITGVDYLKMDREPRFDVVYHLYSFKNNIRIRVKSGVPEEDLDVDSMTGLWG